MVSSKYFIDETLQKQYEELGFVLVENFIDLQAINQLQSFFNGHDPLVNNSFYATNLSTDISNNKKIDVCVRNVLEPLLKKVIQNYRCTMGLFFVKPSGENTKFHIHADWSLVDERRYSSLHLWLPLVDTTPENGNLFVYQGSHKNGLYLRGSPKLDLKFSWSDTIKRFFIPKKNVYMKAGSVLLFNHRLWHGSWPNKSGKKRVAAGISILPENVPMIHYHKHKSGKVEVFEVKDDFYLDYNLNECPQSAKSIGYVGNNYHKSQ